MKTPFSISRLRLPFTKRAAMGVHPQSRRGIALIITLIMISVTLVMAVAFLALARRERVSVSTTTDTVSAKLAADSALAAAQAQIMANIFVTNSSLYNFGPFVSTDYQNGYGYNSVGNYADPTNVNYDYIHGGGALTTPELIQNIANLKYLPRVPVYITNSLTGNTDFRFYLDLNRNGRFETNGVVGNFDFTGHYLNDISEVGDPEWVGILSRPDMAHSANNQFVSRYAFIAIPIGNTLDINAIHNQAQNTEQLLQSQDGYFRNEGVGSWEINLAAFLTDLNTNQWDPPTAENAGVGSYNYLQLKNFNTGRGFEDAFSILTNRYSGNYATLAAPSKFLYNALVFNGIDGYLNGFLMTTNVLPPVTAPGGLPTAASWLGSDNTNHFFDLPDELFAVTNGAVNNNNFAKSLLAAGAGVSTYDRYTYYRLLSQLGTDSDPDAGKMNLNYSNVVVSYNSLGMAINFSTVPGAETNCVPWRPLDFFTAAADRMLRLYSTNWFNDDPSNYLATYYNIPTNLIAGRIDPNTGYGLTNALAGTNAIPFLSATNIPVFMNGQFVYSSAVNRLLQLAANMYDASTTNFYPSVFRPIFWVTNQFGFRNVYIAGYEQITNTTSFLAGTNFYSVPTGVLTIPTNVTALGIGPYLEQNIYGVPWIIGAKKGFPSFNQIYTLNAGQFARRLEVSRSTTDPTTATYATNQMYTMSMTNNIGISFWNSYSNYYPNPLTLYVSDVVQPSLTNVDFPSGFYSYQPNSALLGPTNYAYTTNITLWPGSQWGAPGMALPPMGVPNTGSFYYANWSFNFLPPAVYRLSTGYLVPALTNNGGPAWETGYPLWGLDHQGALNFTLTNYLQTYILDGQHVVDYVQIQGPFENTNLNQVLADPNYTGNPQGRYQWSTNLFSSPNPMTYGVFNQLVVSQGGDAPAGNGVWSQTPLPGGLDPTVAGNEAAFFKGFFAPTFQVGGVMYTNNELTNQAPYTPTKTIYDLVEWQANDPLVHYTASDLNFVNPAVNGWNNTETSGTAIATTPSPTSPGARFQPWGWGATTKQMLKIANGTVNANPYDLMLQDSLVWCPDNWDFPTNKYPTVGWLGRVHRGTPWQTVYLKADNLLTNAALNGLNIGVKTWADWTGNTEVSDGQYFDANNSAPVQDRLLFDLFTTRFNDNAAHGTLSINQTNLAAWSALFSGTVVLSNNAVLPSPSYTERPSVAAYTINPVGSVEMTNTLLGQIVSSINQSRTNASLFPLAEYKHLGDILSVPTLTETSPFLTTNPNPKFLSFLPAKYGISDELYEWLPQQTLSLLRAPTTPRYLVFCYGQALRPAPNALVTDATGGQFGLCTNYQVVAESGVRAIVSVQPQMVTNPATGWPMTNYTMKVESYNVLPPN